MSADAKILDRVKKLLALAESSNEHEAALAMSKAQELMATYGLTEATIRLSDIGHADVHSQFSVSQMKPYELMLMNGIAQAFQTRLLWGKSHSLASHIGKSVYGRFTFVGRKANVQVAEHIAIVLGRKLKKARTQFVQSLSSGYPAATKTAEADGYCVGWVMAVLKKVNRLAVDEETAKLMDEYLQNQIKVAGESKAQERKLGTAGYYQGQRDGADESIHRPMEQGQRQAGIGVTLKIEGRS